MPDFAIPAVDKDENNYAHCQVSVVLPIEADQFFDWYLNEKVENFMKGTLIVPPIVGVEDFDDKTFGPVGTRRLFNFKDGTIAREVVLDANFPHEYSYQPYGYDNPIHLFSDYAKATMRAVPHADGAEIIWDYAFHAKNKMALQVVKLFVSLDWKRNLENGLKIIKAHIDEHGVEKHMDDVADMKIAA